MIKLIVSDMDGSILQSDLSLSERTMSAIQKVQDKGIVFTFATGRPDQLMKEYVDRIGLQEPIISSNGSVIGNPFQAQRIYERGLDKDVVDEALSYLEEHHIMYMIYTKEGILCRPNQRSRFFEERNKTLPKQQRATFLYDEHPASLLHEHIVVNKILVIEPDEETYQTTYQFMSTIPNTNIIQSQNHYIDINPPGVNKGKAVEMLAQSYGFSLDEIVAFGDHHNDIEMIEMAGIGVAMGNAIEELQKHANDIALTNDQDGVAAWLEQHILSSTE